ncbi:NAD(P)/FAD-dependent oxidoreductase [Acidaminobacter sp. JC074]|uniref:NAD(P)/FAD-dependent oxidoreductase n=1 Tax=Acidaminobacter sp. JC074 TaxID=2530199 RepID=UPI001F0F81E1|nr:NAD(P)/FAD-dependent oxidoreductase [Acidaminobacter sp. JC074]MCH4886501.1 NAD(P)/FAD-dependent oxidoreductase [Acidaminobacter sp. JC074]
MYDIAIIGAGVIGASIARELSRYQLKVALLEKENDVSMGTTKANSAIIHAGYDALPNTNKGKFNALGNMMFDKICDELDVPFKRIGSYVLAFSKEEVETLKDLLKRGQDNHIPDMEIVYKEELLKREPNLNPEVVAGLFAPTAGIIGPWELTIALAENAVDNGVDLLLNHQVNDINKDEHFVLETNHGSIEAKFVINCAGVYADKIHNMIAKESFKIDAWKGQYYLLDKMKKPLLNSIMFQCPTEKGKGVLVLPTVHGNTLVGPDSEMFDDKEDVETDSDNLNFIKEKAYKTVVNLPMNQVITSFAGLRAKPSTKDFIIEEASDVKGFIDVAGIESPGLSSAPAIADYVKDMILERIDVEEKEDFNPIRKAVPHFMDLPEEEKQALIKKDPRYGRIVCRCELITEGEIVEAIHRTLGATTVDGIKRRVRPGMGRCQGGFCGAKVMEILARELDKDIKTIVKDRNESFIITGETKEAH